MRTVNPASYKLIERPIYGSSRVGIDNTPLELIGYTAPTSGIHTHVLGLKQYEFSNHLGNVLTTVSDKKIPVDIDNDGTIDYYVADITSATDYYPFGSPMDGRAFGGEKYRFGFNGQEKDDEVAGAGNTNTAMFWEYDTRLGRRWNLDPKPVAWESSYAVNRNNPIWINDPLGDFGDNNGDRKNKKALAKYDEKVRQPLSEMKDAGYAPDEIQEEADRLSEKYQNKKWLHLSYDMLNNNNVANKQYKGGKTNYSQKRPIRIMAYQSGASYTKEIDNNRTQDGTLNTGNTELNAVAGSTVSVQFNPFSQPNSLVVSTNNEGSTSIIATTDGMKSGSDYNPKGVFTFNYIISITNENSGLIYYTIQNTFDTPVGDNYQLRIQVKNPPVFNPTPIQVDYSFP